MASCDAHPARLASAPVYIVGERDNINRCMSYLSGIQQNMGKQSDIWNVHRHVLLHKELLHNVRMAKLKEQALHNDTSMDYEELDLCSDSIGGKSSSSAAARSPQQGYHKMKRLKRDDSSHGDIGYESDDTDEEEDVTVTIHRINVERSTWRKRNMASFIFQCVRPGVIVLAIDSDNCEQQFYQDIIKELGVRAALPNEGHSSLLVVDATAGTVDEQTKKRIQKNIATIQGGIYPTYFSDNFGSCELDELSSKLQELLSDSVDLLQRDNTHEKVIEELFKPKCGIFVNSETENVDVLVEQKAIMRVTYGHKHYVCRPEDLANEFLAILNKIPPMKYKLDLSEFLSCVNHEVTTRMICFKAFEAAGWIRINGNTQVHLLPLISPENLPVFNEVEYSVETNDLRFTVNTDVLPVFVMINIVMNVMKILSLEWELKSSGPRLYKAKYTFLFTNGPMGLLVQFESSNEKCFICLTMLRLSEKQASNDTTEFESAMCDRLRHELESEIKTCRNIPNTLGGSVPVCKKHIRRREYHNSLVTDGKNWTDVDSYRQGRVPLNDDKVIELLNPWFSALGQKIQHDMNRHFEDSVLAKIARLFGSGYRLFFIEQGISSAIVDQIDDNNPKKAREVIFKLLQEWKKLNASRANYSTLRAAIQNSDVNVDLYEYAKIVGDAAVTGVSQNQ